MSDCQNDQVYLGDAVYASFDGYQIWLTTGDGNDNRIALEPAVMDALIVYWAKLIQRYKQAREDGSASPNPRIALVEIDAALAAQEKL